MHAHHLPPRRWLTALPPLALLVLIAVATPASATPYGTISSAGPLDNIWIGNDLSCQVSHVADTFWEIYPASTRPGDCGSFIALGSTLYAPDFIGHGGTATGSLGASTPFTPVSQTPVTGSGTTGSPFTILTTVNVGTTGLQIRETTQYVVGNPYFITSTQIVNTGSSTQNFIFYRAVDCYLGGADTGYGALNINTPGSIACTENPNNLPAGRYEEMEPLSPGSSYYHNFYSSVWSWIGTKTPFPNTCQCTTFLDNGLGLSWVDQLPPGASVTHVNTLRFNPGEVTEPDPCTMTGRAYVAHILLHDVGGTGLVGPTHVWSEDTGEVATTTSSHQWVGLANVTGPLLVGDVVAAEVGTDTDPCRSEARSSIVHMDSGPAMPPPIAPIVIRGAESRSYTDCTHSEGGFTIAYLSVGGTVLINTAGTPPPNTQFTVGPATVIVNEQTGGPGVFEVTGVHVIVNGVMDARFLYARSDIHDCNGPPPEPPCDAGIIQRQIAMELSAPKAALSAYALPANDCVCQTLASYGVSCDPCVDGVQVAGVRVRIDCETCPRIVEELVGCNVCGIDLSDPPTPDDAVTIDLSCVDCGAWIDCTICGQDIREIDPAAINLTACVACDDLPRQVQGICYDACAVINELLARYGIAIDCNFLPTRDLQTGAHGPPMTSVLPPPTGVAPPPPPVVATATMQTKPFG